MGDRVHPASLEVEAAPGSEAASFRAIPALPESEKPVPPLGTYVIQVPKDQIYRVPPPENSLRQQKLARRKPRRSCFCRCLCWTIFLLFLLLLAVAAAAGVLYLVFRPKFPKYSVENIASGDFNLTSQSPFSQQIDVTVRAWNPNRKVGVYYEDGSSVGVYYSNIAVGHGNLPAFYQPPKNATLIQTALRGSNVVFSDSDRAALGNRQRQGSLPLTVKMEAPVKIKIGAIKSPKITLKTNCDVTVSNLTADWRISSKKCEHSVKLW